MNALRRAGHIADAADAAAEAEALISSEDRYLSLSVLENKAILVGMRGDHESAMRLTQELCDKHRALGNRTAAIILGQNLAEWETRPRQDGASRRHCARNVG